MNKSWRLHKPVKSSYNPHGMLIYVLYFKPVFSPRIVYDQKKIFENEGFKVLCYRWCIILEKS